MSCLSSLFAPSTRAALGFLLACASALAPCSALAVSPDLVISQVYGGGGNTGATYKNDYIELYNRGTTPVSLAGWSVQYSAAAGTSWAVTNLTAVTVQPGQYYLVQEAIGAGGTVNLPTPDATGSIAMSGTAGKVALVTSTTALTCGTSCASNAAVRDFVGFGTTANNFEGTGPAPAPSNTTAVLRAGNGATDTDNNAADFSAGAPNPRNSATAVLANGACGSANGSALAAAPTANLCSVGTPSAISGTGPWTWTCASNNGGSSASCSARVATGGPFTVFHMNDVHARLTPHKWIINQHGFSPDVFEDVGGAAHLAGKLLALTAAKPTALVLDGGDISEGNPVGDMNGSVSGGYGNGGMTAFYTLLHNKLKVVPGRGGRGMDALVVGNHDVRDISYITNMEAMRNAGVPVLSINVRDIATHQPHFAATTTVTVNGTKIGIIGYTTSSAQVGASLATTLEVVDCQWTGSTVCNISTYVNDLRNNQGCDVVILLTHDGHSDLVDPLTPVLADTAAAKVPEIAVTGHWHTWTDTVWQPQQLNYKTIFTESASYMKYLGELNVTGTGAYLSSTQHVLRNADITPDADVQAFVAGLINTYNAGHDAAHPVTEVVGYTNSALLLDNRMKWWSADEYPWNGNNTAGQWITDAMKWKCDQIWSASGGCDLAVEAGGGVRADIPSGAMTYLQVYETFPWADDTYVRMTMTGQDIINFLKATNMGAGFSAALDVTAFDGIPTSVKMNGQPIGLTTVYKVAINNYMQAHPPSGYSWPAAATFEADPGNTLVRDSLSEFMRSAHGSPATAYDVGGPRYHFNGEYSGGYRAVITMMDDVESKPTFEKAFIRLLNALPETLARRGSRQVPAELVNADGSINQANRLAEQELYRSFLGFKRGMLKVGDIIETWGKASFFDGNPEFVDQEGVYGDGQEFKIVGHDATLALPTGVPSLGAVLSDQYKNHLVKVLARKTGGDTVIDQYGQTVKIWDATAYNTVAIVLPGVVGDVLEITAIPTMENFATRVRLSSAVVSPLPLPTPLTVSSNVDPLPATVGGPVTLNANTSAGVNFNFAPLVDAQVASGNPSTNYGTSTNIYVQSSSINAFGNERGWLRFDLSVLPAGLGITGASLKLWNWKSTGAALPTEVRGGNDDSWTETGITWATQPTYGIALSTMTLAAGATGLYYGWDVLNFVQSKYAGNKLVSLVVKAVTEGSADATAPSYGFDTKEYGSNIPTLQVTAQGTVASVRLFFRYSADNTNWGAWTQYGAPLTVAPYNASFAFPNGNGTYQFYSVATDSLGNTESTPLSAQAVVQYTAALAAQTISFGNPGAVTVGSVFTVAATATSALPVAFSSQTPTVCTLATAAVTTVSVGTCSIAASQAGDSSWAAAPTVVQSFAVAQATQTISFPPLSDTPLSSGTLVVEASASSGLPVTLTSQTLNVCTVSGTTVQLLNVGNCTLVASQAGNANTSAASVVTRSFAVVTTTSSGGSDGDVPLPPWALGLLSLGLVGALRARSRRALQ